MGKRPVARFKRGYKWTYLYAFVHPQSGEVYWLIAPTVNVELFSMTLNDFAREVGAGTRTNAYFFWWDSPARADTLTLRGPSFFHSILLEVRGTPVAQR